MKLKKKAKHINQATRWKNAQTRVRFWRESGVVSSTAKLENRVTSSSISGKTTGIGVGAAAGADMLQIIKGCGRLGPVCRPGRISNLST